MAKTKGALVQSGRRFMNSGGNSGRWAGERFMAAVAAGRRITPSVLRTAELLRDEEWKAFDNSLVTGARMRLRAVQDLLAAGLTFTISNGLAKTILEWDKIGDMNEAIVSMDGVTRDENDRLEFESEQFPLPITHKDWYLNLRLLEASRLGDTPLDTTYSRVAGEKIGEKTEEILFNGTKQFGNLKIYGYRTHPDRHTLNFGTGGSWDTPGKTGAQMYEDLVTGIQALRDAHQYGPYMVYLPTGAELQMGNDYKAESDKTVQQRLLEIEGMSGFRIVDNVPANEMIIVSMQASTVDMVIGERLQTIQWDAHGGFQVNFKGFQIMVPRIRTDADGNSGVAHFTSV
jgi:uncharacterized linocin/CFP29 family protein